MNDVFNFQLVFDIYESDRKLVTHCVFVGTTHLSPESIIKYYLSVMDDSGLDYTLTSVNYSPQNQSNDEQKKKA